MKLSPKLRRFCAVLLPGLVAAACGTTDPSPVGISLVDLAGGEVVEVPNIRPVASEPRLRELFPTVLGEADEVLVGRMNGIEYSGVFQVAMQQTDFPGGDATRLSVDSLFVELKLLGNLVRGDLGTVRVSIPDESWTEGRTFVDTTTFMSASFERVDLHETLPVRRDSTIRIQLPAELLIDAIAEDPNEPVVEFVLSGVEGEEYLIVAGSRDAELAGKTPELVAYYANGTISRAGSSLDTYYADRVSAPSDGEVLLQTGVLTGAALRFDLPSIPPSATVNLVQLSLDYDFNRSFHTSLRLRIERLIVSDGDTTSTIVSGNQLNEQVIAPTSSPFLMNLDQLMFHGWMSGNFENQGLVITPIFEVASDLRYEWGLFTNPRLRIVYSLPPSIGS